MSQVSNHEPEVLDAWRREWAVAEDRHRAKKAREAKEAELVAKWRAEWEEDEQGQHERRERDDAMLREIENDPEWHLFQAETLLASAIEEERIARQLMERGGVLATVPF